MPLTLGLLPRGEPLGAAVSGGADSVALLHLLVEAGFCPLVLHVNHGLRGAESDGDEQFVRTLAQQLDLRCLVHTSSVPGPGNQEQAARDIRYRWFHSLISSGTLNRVATAHTLDDQAETVLFRLLRGAGSAGLSAILPENRGIVRPLLSMRRCNLRQFLEQHHFPWREDSSNANLRFRRNRIRHQLLPSLRAWNPSLDVTLAQTAEWAQAEEQYWQDVLPGLLENWVRFGKNSAVLEAAALCRLPLAAARRAVRAIAVHAQTSASPIPFAHVEQVLRLASRPKGSGSFRTASWVAQRSGAYLRVAPPGMEPAPYRFPVTPPGTYLVPGDCRLIRLELKPMESVYNDGGQQVDWALVSGSLELRNWRPGDKLQTLGNRTPRGLKHFFQEAGIPSWERTGWPVLTCDNSVLWSRGQGVSAAFAPSPSTARVLSIEEVVLDSPNQNVSV